MAKTIISETPAVNMIGKGTIIKGDIRSDGDFRVDGTLHGSIQSNGKIVVGVTGTIEGDITCQNADLSGQVKAIIRVKELLSLKATSKVTGEVHTSKLAIEPGARFSGTCNMEDEAEIRAQKESMQHGSITREKEKITG
ncbi:MAG: polymer-forming cytoskeletal protein [Bacteroidales bacterium]|jgi:cytoskeletal protein CcmA (bactofilin family)|nr:polymer-forming cytoskeletal protein [Bacteroidales bacterium]